MREAAYWITLAHMPKWGYSKINNLIIRFFHNEKITIEDFFNLDESIWKSNYQLNNQDVADLRKAKSELPSNAFLAENLFNQGFELIPITSNEYSKNLKSNLKISYAPSLLYVKGDKQIFQEDSIAIVGSREASDKALAFTDNVASLASKNYKVIVSGFAKGVDKQALDSAIKYKGRSVIVLPQGVATFTSGYKSYYKQIIEGDVVVVSVFHPKAGWSSGLAMARNPIIYGLASDIYVAESSEKGGTWSGVIDGLRKGRKIYVRMPEANELNANVILIEKGATAVDFNGEELSNFKKIGSTPILQSFTEENITEQIIGLFNGKSLSAKDIIEKLGLNWSAKKLTGYLQQQDKIQKIKKGNTNHFYIIKADPQTSLF